MTDVSRAAAESDKPAILILGCGYTGRRVAERLLRRGYRVLATTRSGQPPVPGVDARRVDLPSTAALGPVPAGVAVLHSIPVVEAADGLMEATPELLRLLGTLPSRVVYLSTTGVYGTQRDVDETTPTAPADARTRLRVAAEEAVLGGPWPALVLRPAAIYGPGRGVQERMLQGTWRLVGDGSNYVSRIHVDDLAALTEAALLNPGVTGAFPVADDEPCTGLEITRYCAELLRLPVPGPGAALHRTRTSNRRVDGSAVRRLLGVELRYPSYRSGVPACLTDAPR